MTPYIIKALQTNDSVFVNGLGSFVKKYEPAHIEGNSILPPRFTVSLDPNCDHDEIAFTNFVCREKQCLLTKANAELNEWVSQLKTALQNNKSVTYDDFGTFTINNKGILTFEGNDIAELNIEFEGMNAISTEGIATVPEPVETPAEEEEEIKPVWIPEPEPVAETPTPEPVETPAEEPSAVETPAVEDDEDDDVEVVRPKCKRRWWWLLLVVLLLAALGAAGYLFRSQLQQTYQTVTEKIFHKTEPAEEPAETVSESTDNAESIEVVEQTTEEEAAPEVYTPAVTGTTANGNFRYIDFESGHYYAIAGSFPSEKDIETHIRQKGLDQYDLYLVRQSGNPNIRVCIGIFDTEDEATTFAKNINPHYWVLK